VEIQAGRQASVLAIFYCTVELQIVPRQAGRHV
jgi:hypothetical protein